MKLTPNAINHLSIAAFLASRGFHQIELPDQDINALMIDTRALAANHLRVYKSPFDQRQCSKLYVYGKTNMFKDDTLGITGFLSDLIPHYYCCSIEEVLTDPERFDLVNPTTTH